MDDHHFDALTRSMSIGANRRTTVTGLIAGALTAALGGIGLAAAKGHAGDGRTGRGTDTLLPNSCNRDDMCFSGRCERNKEGMGVCVCRNKGASCLVDGKKSGRACCSMRCRKDGKCA